MRIAAGIAMVAIHCLASAAPGDITTVAGAGAGDEAPALRAYIQSPQHIAVDAAGNIYFLDPSNWRVRKITPDGLIHTIVGNGLPGDSERQVTNLTGIAVDSGGNVYFSEGCAPFVGCDQAIPSDRPMRHRVRKITPSGTITTVAGTGIASFAGDGGPATSAGLNNPTGLAVNATGDLFICDQKNQRVRKVSGGIITTVAGNGTISSVPAGPYPGEGGPATSTEAGCGTIAVDPAGGFFIGSHSRILHVSATGTLSTFAGTGEFSFGSGSGDNGPALNATFFSMWQIATDASGAVYVAEWQKIRKIGGDGLIVPVVGTGQASYGGDDGPATAAQIQSQGVAIAPGGDIVISDSYNDRIRRVTAGIIRTVAGPRTNLVYDATGVPATSVRMKFWGPTAVAFDGGLLIADGSRVRRVAVDGTISTVIGSDSASGFSGDGGPAASATFSYIAGLAFDSLGNLYLADSQNHRVRRVSAAGIVTTVVGTGVAGDGGDFGPALQAQLDGPRSVAVDAAGNLYVGTWTRIRKVDGAGTITPFAGNGAQAFAGDAGPASAAAVSVIAMAIDPQGGLVVAGHERIRRIDSTGIIQTIAGTGTWGFAGDGGPATAAMLASPQGVAFDSAGNLYVGDAGNNRIRMIDPAGVISTVAGTGISAYSGEGVPARTAPLFTPSQLTYDSRLGLVVTEPPFSLPAPGTLYANGITTRIRSIEISDASPDPFTFGSRGGVATSSTLVSAVVTPTGFVAPAFIRVEGGEYSIGCSGVFTSAAATIAPGQSVCVRHTTSADNNVATVTTLQIGGERGTFETRTVVGPGTTALSSLSIDFGTHSMNTTAPPRTATLTNAGAGPVTVHRVSTVSPFRVTHDCASLAPGVSCTATVRFTPATAAAANGTLVFNVSSGDQVVSLGGSGELSLTAHYYNSILGRLPDTQGRNFWEGEATRLTAQGVNINEVWFAMSMSFFFSPEYLALNRDNAGFVADLYNTFFNRAPDPSGVAFWANQLAGGLPREVMIASFMFSPEFAAFTQVIFGNTQARAEVDVVMDFYRGLLARIPEDTGLAHWLGRLRTAQCAASPAAAIAAEIEAISSQFTSGAEYLGRNRTNAQYVGDLYNAFLRRGGELTGVNFWINELATGARTREKERTDFRASAEFQLRVQRIISQGCLR